MLSIVILRIYTLITSVTATYIIVCIHDDSHSDCGTIQCQLHFHLHFMLRHRVQFYMYFFDSVAFELSISHLLGRCLTTRTTLTPQVIVGQF
jgi:hypothetical protein